MKYLKLVIVLAFLSTQLYSQDTVEEYVQEGVVLHDNGEYDKAIETYKKALKINPNSALVNYEIALSYFSKKDYKKSIKHSDKVIDLNDELVLQAYLSKGSSLDMMNKTKESIKVFEKAIESTAGHYLLDYNLALNYYKTNKFDKAETNAINALQKNSNHPSSHLMLANIHQQKGNRVQTLLSAHYFLFLEPNSERSLQVLDLIHENMKRGVSKDVKKDKTINILVSDNGSQRFSAAELMLSLMEASNSSEENSNKSQEELFEENTKNFFSVLGELNEVETRDIWNSFYIPFFHDLSKSNNIQTYCKYITQAKNQNSRLWLESNPDMLDQFDKWLQNN